MVIKINKGGVFTIGTYLVAWPVDQLLPDFPWNVDKPLDIHRL